MTFLLTYTNFLVIFRRHKKNIYFMLNTFPLKKHISTMYKIPPFQLFITVHTGRMIENSSFYKWHSPSPFCNLSSFDREKLSTFWTEKTILSVTSIKTDGKLTKVEILEYFPKIMQYFSFRKSKTRFQIPRCQRRIAKLVTLPLRLHKIKISIHLLTTKTFKRPL